MTARVKYITANIACEKLGVTRYELRHILDKMRNFACSNTRSFRVDYDKWYEFAKDAERIKNKIEKEKKRHEFEYRKDYRKFAKWMAKNYADSIPPLIKVTKNDKRFDISWSRGLRCVVHYASNPCDGRIVYLSDNQQYIRAFCHDGEALSGFWATGEDLPSSSNNWYVQRWRDYKREKWRDRIDLEFEREKRTRQLEAKKFMFELMSHRKDQSVDQFFGALAMAGVLSGKNNAKSN